MSGRPAGEAAPLRPLDAGTGFGTFAPPPPYGDDDGGARTDPDSEHAFEDDVKAPVGGAFIEPEVVEAEFEAEIVRWCKPPQPCRARCCCVATRLPLQFQPPWASRRACVPSRLADPSGVPPNSRC